GRKDQREEGELQVVGSRGKQPPELSGPERPPLRRGCDVQLEERIVPGEAGAKRGQARGELRQEEQAKQRRRLATRLELGDSGHELPQLCIGCRTDAYRLAGRALGEGERDRPGVVP